MGEQLSSDPEFARMISRRTRLSRWAVPAELKGPVVFLAPSSSPVNGRVLTIDGGLTASLFQPDAFQAETEGEELAL